MSNTLNTPVEALELEFPLRVERYELRYGSGGAGARRGGDGIDRRVRVLEPATACVLADRRRHGPAGKQGGEAGAPGRTLLDEQELPPKATVHVEAGTLVTVLTPGGGGYGRADER
jgi:N-methylhydantoinase B